MGLNLNKGDTNKKQYYGKRRSKKKAWRNRSAAVSSKKQSDAEVHFKNHNQDHDYALSNDLSPLRMPLDKLNDFSNFKNDTITNEDKQIIISKEQFVDDVRKDKNHFLKNYSEIRLLEIKETLHKNCFHDDMKENEDSIIYESQSHNDIIITKLHCDNVIYEEIIQHHGSILSEERRIIHEDNHSAVNSINNEILCDNSDNCKANDVTELVNNITDNSCNDENCNETENLEHNNRYIIDFDYVFREMQNQYLNHAVTNCSFRDWTWLREKTTKYGLINKFFFYCHNCKYECAVWSEPQDDDNYMDCNTEAVSTCLTIGIGHTGLQELCAGMNIDCMSDKKFKKIQDFIHEQVLLVSEQSMKEAGEEAKRLATERGDITETGVPFTKVITDGSWGKRSYSTNFDSSSGAAVIVDYYTRKVLFYDTRNKYCVTCARASNSGTECPEHICYKNWSTHSSSSAMETDIILDGFKQSIEMHGLIYKTIITDGDSSVYKAIVDNNVYKEHNVVPERILCTNHLLRNLCKKLAAISKITQPHGQPRIQGFVLMRNIVKSNVLRIRQHVEQAVTNTLNKDCPWNTKVDELQKCLLNLPYHVFGEHKDCNGRYGLCNTEGPNYVPKLEKLGFFPRIIESVTYTSQFSDSLLHCVTNNSAEWVNSHIGKDLGGKRINFSQTNQYDTRVGLAALHYNSQQPLIQLHEALDKKVPLVLHKVTKQRQEKVLSTRRRRRENGRKKKKSFKNCGYKFYGKKHVEVDKSDQVMKNLRENLYQKLNDNQSKRDQIERDTVEQRRSPLWVSLRKQLLTASNFKLACTWNSNTSCAMKVKTILYPPVNANNPCLMYGIEQEKIAKEKLSLIYKHELQDCGLFIDKQYAMLACSPDGLIGDDGLLEIKSPYLGANMSASDAIKHCKSVRDMFSSKNINKINESHAVYYQIQGQLHITERQYCILVIHTPKSQKKIRIDVDHDFWKHKMEAQLLKFYNDCMVPEILDSRHNRNMPIRNPAYTFEAIVKRKSLQQLKEKKQKIPLSQRESTKKKINQFESSVSEVLNDKVTELTKDNEEDRYIISVETMEITDADIARFTNDFENRIISINDVRLNVLPVSMKLNDASIDAFLRVLASNNKSIATQSTLYMYVYDCKGTEPVYHRSIQILGGRCTDHWRCFDFDSNILKVYDSLPEHTNFTLSEQELLYIKKRFPSLQMKNIIFANMKTRQKDGIICGVYAAAFATSLAFGKDPSKIQYDTNAAKMRSHFVRIVEQNQLAEFPEL